MLTLALMLAAVVGAQLALPKLHAWSEAREWALLLQEARDCTAARDDQ
jgi:hypothetical protein